MASKIRIRNSVISDPVQDPYYLLKIHSNFRKKVQYFIIFFGAIGLFNNIFLPMVTKIAR
jgi:hypothetical protein